MSTLELFTATGMTTKASSSHQAHWPHLSSTGTVVHLPRAECDLAGMDADADPEAARLVRSIQAGLGLTIGQIAKALGCSRQAVHGWMRGKRVEAGNRRNLRTLRDWVLESGPRLDPDRLDLELLEELGRLGLSSPEARALWERRLLGSSADPADWDALPKAEGIARRIGAEPVSELVRSQRRAHNLGSLRIDSRG